MINIDNEALIKVIITHNQLDINPNKIEIEHKYKTKQKCDNGIIIIKVEPEIYVQSMKMCYKCSGYGHIVSKCASILSILIIFLIIIKYINYCWCTSF